MNPIDLIVTVCAVLSPTTCEETHLVFSYNGSLRQCVMAAPPYIAQWVGEHPKWTAVKWRCEYPHTNDKADAGKGTPAAEARVAIAAELFVAVLQILVRNRKHCFGLDLDIANDALP